MSFSRFNGDRVRVWHFLLVRKICARSSARINWIVEAESALSTRFHNDSPKARAIRQVTLRVGFARSRSISLSIERLTPLADASSSSDHPRSPRSFFTRLPRSSLIDSVSAATAGFPGVLTVRFDATRNSPYWNIFPVEWKPGSKRSPRKHLELISQRPGRRKPAEFGGLWGFGEMAPERPEIAKTHHFERYSGLPLCV